MIGRYSRLMLITTIVLGGLGFVAKYMVVRNIQCVTQNGICRDELLDKIKASEGKPLISAFKSLNSIAKADTYVANYGVNFLWPSGLRLIVMQKSANFAASAPGSEHIALADNKGYILEYVNTTDLPLVISNSVKGSVGERLDERTLFSLELLEHLDSLYGIDSAEVKENGVYAKYKEMTIIFPVSGDKSYLLGSLELLLSRLKEQQKEPRISSSDGFGEIDLRFKNPVLRN